MGSTCDLSQMHECMSVRVTVDMLVVNSDDLLSYFCSDKSELNTQLATCHFVTEMVPDVIGAISCKYEFVTLN